MSAPTLTEFLLARIAEDEAVAREATPGPWYWDEPSEEAWSTGDESLRSAGRKMTDPAGKPTEWDDTVLYGWGYDASGIQGEKADRDHIARHAPDRVLSQCAALRGIIEECVALIDSFGDWDANPDARKLWPDVSRRERSQAHNRMLGIADIWADHPDYREEWKP